MLTRKELFQFYQPLSTANVLYVREGEGDGQGQGAGAGQGQGQGDDIDAKIAAAVDAATKGLKAKNDELLGKLKSSNDRLKAFDGFDPEKMRKLQEKLDSDEDAQLLATGDKQKVIEKYTERMRNDFNTQLETERNNTKAAMARAEAFAAQVLDNQIRAVTNGLHKTAVEDALLHARQIFSLDAEGKAVKLGSDNQPELGKDGKTPFSPAEWIESMKEAKPHWFPTATSGSGSGDARPGSGQGKTMKRADFEALSVDRRSEVLRNGTRLID